MINLTNKFEKKNFMDAMMDYLADQGAPITDDGSDDLLYYNVDMADFGVENGHEYETRVTRDDFEYVAEHQHGDLVESWGDEDNQAIQLDSGEELGDLVSVEDYYGLENVIAELDISVDDAYEIIEWHKMSK